MLIRLHAPSVHATQLHCVCIGTPPGEGHGNTLTSTFCMLTTNYILMSSHLVSCPQVKTGFVMNILGILSVSLAMNTWGVAMFNLNSYPEWAHPANNTALIPNVLSVNATL